MEDERSSGSDEADTGQGRPTVVVRDGGQGIRGGRRVNASPRTVTVVDRPFARRHCRLARGGRGMLHQSEPPERGNASAQRAIPPGGTPGRKNGASMRCRGDRPAPAAGPT